MTAASLVLAANTSFADFPRLASSTRGRFHAAAVYEARAPAGLQQRNLRWRPLPSASVIFQANVDKMIPLYALGVFISFTMSQTG